MDLKQLQYFVAAADEGSISGAARRLFVTQPPVSVQIQQLEKELGGPLLVRGGRRLELTPAGRDFAQKTIVPICQAEQQALEHLGIQEAEHYIQVGQEHLNALRTEFNKILQQEKL